MKHLRSVVTSYLADIVESIICTLCAMTGHAGACWLVQGKRSPLRRLYFRALDCRRNQTPRQAVYHPKCQFCGADHDVPPTERPSMEELLDAAYKQGRLDGQQQAMDFRTAFKDERGRIVVVRYPN